MNMNVQLYSLVVDGTLDILNRPDAAIYLRTICVTVRPGGKILAGSASAPFMGSLQFLFAGDDLTESSHCGGMKGRTLSIGQGAEVALYGDMPQGRMWTSLRTTVEPAGRTLVLRGQMNWQIDDEIVIATASEASDETEFGTIEAIKHVLSPLGGYDTEISITQPLQYRHIGASEVYGTHALEMASEVGLLVRPRPKAAATWPAQVNSIHLAAVDTLTSNFKFKTTAVSYLGMLILVDGSLIADGVRMENGGAIMPGATVKAFGDKVIGMLQCRGSSSICTVRRSVLVSRVGRAVDAKSGGGHFENNVFWKSQAAFHIKGAIVLLHNAIFDAGPGFSGLPPMGEINAASSAVSIQDGGRYMVVIGNSVAGAAGPAWSSFGFDIAESSFRNNSGHAADVGWGINGVITTPFQDVTLWRIRTVAIWGYSKSDTPVISNVRLVDSFVHFFWAMVGGDPEKHTIQMQTVIVQNSLFVGRSVEHPSCKNQVGVLLPVAASEGYSISPHQCGTLGGPYFGGIYGHLITAGSNPPLAAEVRVTGTTFRNFEESCGGSSTVFETTMRGGQSSSDAVPPLYTSKISIDASSRANLAYLGSPKRDWITPTECVVMDCDGPKHVMIHDLDGTLTGLGADASILARAEYMNQLRQDTTKYTWYNIPSKMLYDPAPYNDLTDPGHDMSAYMAYSGGGGSFSYRQLQEEPADERHDGHSNSDTAYFNFTNLPAPVVASVPRPATALQGSAAEHVRTTSLAVGAAGQATVDASSHVVYSTADANGQGRVVTSAEYHAPTESQGHGRLLASETESDWSTRMVFYQGDERDLFTEGKSCDPTSAIFDPLCRTKHKTHKEVAFNGYGTYRGATADSACTLNEGWNAWVCEAKHLKPARFIIENMDDDHTSRMITPVALATGGYVDLLNGGWDHQDPKVCGGYSCMQRLMTFHTTVAVNRSYDLAFTASNPRHMRLIMPSGGGETSLAGMETNRLLVSIFYSSPEQLQVFYREVLVEALEAHLPSSNSYNFTMRKPVLTDPCGSNAFAAWENKLYVLICGGTPGVEIKTIEKVVLSLGIEISTEDFFDSHYLVRNLASLFGIPEDQMRVPKIVAGSLSVDVEVLSADPCKEVATCGPHGSCKEGECVCADGWTTPDKCNGGDCQCSKEAGGCPDPCESCHVANQTCTECKDSHPLLFNNTCTASCPTTHMIDPSSKSCVQCSTTCKTCHGGQADQCTTCHSHGKNAYWYNGQCLLQCPEKSYSDDNRVCHDCSARCKSCTGPLSTECTSCTPNCAQRSSLELSPPAP